MKVDRSKVFVVSWAKMIGEGIEQVGFAGSLVILEVVLRLAILEPAELHAHGFGFLWFDDTVGDAIGSAVVGANRGGWL